MPQSLLRTRAAAATLALTIVLSLALIVGALAACTTSVADLTPLPTRTAIDISSDELAQGVADALQGVNFVQEEELFGLELETKGEFLLVRGTIDSSSPKDVHAALMAAPNVKVLVLINIPGSLDDDKNLEMGRMLRAAGLSTYLPAEGMVASGGTDLLVAGVNRYVEEGALVGVHSWADAGGTTGDQAPRDHEYHQPYLDYYDVMGIPQDFYWYTLQAAPPEDLHWMTVDEMSQYKVYTELR